MKLSRPKRIDGRVPVLSAADAINYIPDEATLCVLGAGGGILEATTLINALAEKYKNAHSPRNLSLISPTGLGDRADRGISPLAQEGLVKWALCGHWGQSPRISDLAEQNKIAAYNYPQGVLTQTLRASAAHQPGILSEIGIGTFVDPRQQGGKLNEVTTEDLIKLVEIDNKEYLYYKAIAPNIAFIRATTCDSEGYATFEDEVMYLDALVIAQAVHNNGGIVMMQVQKMVKKATLHPKAVRIPGYLVDIVVIDPDQTQLYGGAPVNRFISGDFVLDDSQQTALPLNQRKLVARRALFEMRKGAVGNVGVGIADGIGLVAREEGCADDFILTVETGPIGGITSQGIAFGANVNTRAILDMTSQFDFYHGGGLGDAANLLI
ncbi:acetyl-CoA:acetoacetyl-CoA transferase alpha/beta subunit [Citrobacter sp. RHBSTW-00446]|nr:acetyl-CoA:acetoacetyl-CoA transferase alpha/beta subunit [Citrobacter sp. RHBSTW-00827]MBA7938928.1 acetyl-CoA:acetoacetyl-CoA transferase alpha/beta subunit [Citrobacter sp. RHBSTW-00509]QLS94962.1 acetyl-CoA:acetoacetyl-CoA transferase alpha/beta subunit [Citrobacter sp. RHBSTW-00859]QLT54344.1 acetyl-CoA:acetoacetyl-CoA transferase alpha/beta subunit [Citrobacter sp. RHBSTW-00821]QLU30625.1 acetyl-CoA:acetoacetyl-CoA transferase alpha/beta subunit [Citrobacter sp. RHBSTW-00446]QLZ78660.